MNAQLLIAAGGMGTRLGCDGPKALVTLAGTPLLLHTLARFAPLGLLDSAVVVFPAGYEADFQRCLTQALPGHAFVLVEGGSERQVSVRNGLDRLDSRTEVVVIHDAARPFVPSRAISASCDAAQQTGAATVAVPCSDTILEADSEAYLKATPDRSRLWACQTPQSFRVEVIREAHEAAERGAYTETDDASLVRRTGKPVKLVMGAPLNFKVTTPDDFALAALVIEGGLT